MLLSFKSSTSLYALARIFIAFAFYSFVYLYLSRDISFYSDSLVYFSLNDGSFFTLVFNIYNELPRLILNTFFYNITYSDIALVYALCFFWFFVITTYCLLRLAGLSQSLSLHITSFCPFSFSFVLGSYQYISHLLAFGSLIALLFLISLRYTFNNIKLSWFKLRFLVLSFLTLTFHDSFGILAIFCFIVSAIIALLFRSLSRLKFSFLLGFLSLLFFTLSAVALFFLSSKFTFLAALADNLTLYSRYQSTTFSSVVIILLLLLNYFDLSSNTSLLGSSPLIRLAKNFVLFSLFTLLPFAVLAYYVPYIGRGLAFKSIFLLITLCLVYLEKKYSLGSGIVFGSFRLPIPTYLLSILALLYEWKNLFDYGLASY